MATKKRYIDEDGLRTFASEVKEFVEKKVADSDGGGAVTSVNGKVGDVVLDKSDVNLENAVEKSDILDDNNKILTEKLPDFIFGQLLFGGLIMEASNKSNGTLSPSSAFANRFNTTQSVQTITPSQAATYSNTYFIVQDFSAGSSTYTDAQILGVTGLTTGDWIVSDGSSWQRVDNTDAVKTVDGRSGIVDIMFADGSLIREYKPAGYDPSKNSDKDLLTTAGANNLRASIEAALEAEIASWIASYITDEVDVNKITSVGAVKNYLTVRLGSELAAYLKKTEASSTYTTEQQVKDLIDTKIQNAITAALNTAV